jgi:hypothetical protein
MIGRVGKMGYIGAAVATEGTIRARASRIRMLAKHPNKG